MKHTPFQKLYDALQHGDISRREFLTQATALGMGASVALFAADAVAESTPAASPAASPSTMAPVAVGKAPDAGTEGQQRGAGGELKIMQWQAPSQLNGLVATGDKDNLAASFVSEPLMVRDGEGKLIPVLVDEVPTVENGKLKADLTAVTYTLKKGVTWSDGKPLTANDCKFTVEWATNDENGATLQASYKKIAKVDVKDDLTFTLTFANPNPTWAETFTGSGSGVVLPAHVLTDAAAADAFRSNPIGTGPYKVESFTVQDQVVFVVNESYREPNKPFFNKVTLKGGGDAASAARSCLQTGEYDFAWNLTVEPKVLETMRKDDSPGEFQVVGGLNIERVNINFSDPDQEVDGQKSEMNTPHPILSDKAVRQAMTLGIDREDISNKLYLGQDAEPGIANVLSGIPDMESPNSELKYDPDGAQKILDDAGWSKDGDVRKKDGKELKLRLYTTTSAIRQKEQAMIKASLEKIGFKIELQQVDSAVFFDSAVGNDQSNTHFYTDMNMFTSTVSSPPPVAYMVRWYAGKDRKGIAQKANGWAGRNIQRYINDEYDALYEQASVEPDMKKAADLFIKLNDILYNDYAVIPLIRQGKKAGVSKKLRLENVALNPFEFDYWNIANWNRPDGQ